MKKILLCFPLFILLFYSCKNDHNQDTLQKIKSENINSLDYRGLAKELIERADIQSSQSVLVVTASSQFEVMVNLLRKEVENRGGTYLGTISITSEQPEEWSTAFTESALGINEEEMKDLFERVDLGIMMPGASPEHLPYKVLQDILQEGTRRTIHFHWAGAYDLNGNLLDNTAYIDSFYQHVVLNTDYEELAKKQRQFENQMRDSTIRVTSPGITDISFQIGDRPVTKQDGDASANRAEQGRNLIDREIEIPSGAIRVAPIEESVNGRIAFPNALWDGEEVEDLVVTIKGGKITLVTATKGKEAAIREMEKAGPSGKSFREFALGFNDLMPLQNAPMDWIPYYGYGAGIVRLSLGDNTELGGKVGGGYVRWNFFPDATVYVGSDIWVKEGEIIYQFD